LTESQNLHIILQAFLKSPPNNCDCNNPLCDARMSSTIEAAATTTADGIVTTLVPVAKTTQDIQQVTTDIIGVAPSDPANKTADAVALTTTTKAIPAAASSTTTTKSTTTTITPSAAKATTASLAEDYSYDYSDEYKEDDDKAILAAALPTKATKSNSSVGSSSTTPTTLGSTTNPTTQGTIATTTLGTTTTTTLGTTTTTATTLGTTTSTPSTTTATTTTTTTTTSSEADEYSYDDYDGDYEGEYGEYGEEDYSYQDYDYSVFEEAERENQESYKELVDSLNVLSNPKPITRVAVNIFQDLPPGERPLTAGDLYVRDPLIWSSYNEFSAQVIGKLYLSVPSLFGGILLGVGLWSLFITLFKLGCKIKNYCMPKEIGSNHNAGVGYQTDANHHNGGIVNIAAENDQGFCQIASQKEDGSIDAAEYTRDDAIVIAGKKTNFSSGGSAFAAPPEPHLQRNSPSSQGHAFSLTSSSTNGAAASSETSTWLADPGAASGSCRCGGSDVVVTNKNDSSPSQSVPSSDSIGVQTEWPRQLASTEDSSSSSEAIEMPNSVAPP